MTTLARQRYERVEQWLGMAVFGLAFVAMNFLLAMAESALRFVLGCCCLLAYAGGAGLMHRAGRRQSGPRERGEP